MNLLPETWFIPIPVKTAKSNLFWTNTYYKKDLEELNLQLNILRNDKTSNELNLGIISSLPAEPFYDSQKWKNYQNSIFYLHTDRFFNPYSPDLGSGRNALLGKACWKGVGRNFTATRVDNFHSSGMLSSSTALTEILFDYVLSKHRPDLRVPIWAAGVYQEQPSTFLVRSNQVIRCSQVPGFIKKEEREIFKQYLKEQIPGIAEKELFHYIMMRLTRSLAQGIYHISPTPDNITIDGRFIDNQSVEWIDFKNESFLSAQIYFKQENISSKERFFSGDYETIDVENISNISTQAYYIQGCHHALFDAFNSIGLTTISWEEIENEVAQIIKLPPFFFNLDKVHIPAKFEYLKAYFNQVKKYDKIEIEVFENKWIFINSGSRMNNKTHELFKKMLIISRLTNKEHLQPQDLSDLLTRVLSAYSLN